MATVVVKLPLLEGAQSLHSTRAAQSHPHLAQFPAADPAARGRTLLESHYGLIQQKLHSLSRRSGLPEHEAEEFRSWALLKLIEDDYSILARWEGRSSFSTYLNVVLVNLMRDFRTHIWGKWRPSAEAYRQGREGVILERLLVRDGLPLDEAIQRTLAESGVSLSPAELEQIAVKLPRRCGRRRVGEEEMLRIAVDGQVESRVEEGERERVTIRLRELLLPLLRSLPAEQRLLLKLYYWDGLSMAALSPLLGRPQRELYSLRDRCLKKIRRSLEKASLDAEQVREIFGGTQWDINPEDGDLLE
jgi:RNA polymerase sigma factor (sigma-70 family)